MTYILSAHRDLGPPASTNYWEQYQTYLRTHRDRFPRGAYALATSDWYFTFSDHRSPHDAWLESDSSNPPRATGTKTEP